MLGERPWRAAYVEPCRRPTDGRYGQNPNRLARYYQFQVILKPAPKDILNVFLRSLKAIGLDCKRHDVRWLEDDWESPTLGAGGVGWEVRLDGMEITQFTYFQQMAGVALKPIPVEITYGLERLGLFVQKKNAIYDLKWNDEATYGQLYKESEKQFSNYHFDCIDAPGLRRHFDDYEREFLRLAETGNYMPAYDYVLKCSHTFNLLDASASISVAERTRYISRVRGLAKKSAQAYLESLEQKNG